MQELDIPAYDNRSGSLLLTKTIAINIAVDESLHAFLRVENDAGKLLTHVMSVAAGPHPKQIGKVRRNDANAISLDLSMSEA
jgi:hypothetical protein